MQQIPVRSLNFLGYRNTGGGREDAGWGQGRERGWYKRHLIFENSSQVMRVYDPDCMKKKNPWELAFGQ